MAVHPDQLVRHIHRLVEGPTPTHSDAELLERFLSRRDEAAFAALVQRHGPMVLGVCRRVLPNAHDADDAFQAAFLILARKADSIQPRSSLAAWLHGVARRTALMARTADARRRRREAPAVAAAPADPRPDPLAEISARDLLTVIDAEVQRLPEAQRLAVVLCCLEGLSQEEAARMLGWTPGSVKGRLERGRARLHARLARRGLTVAATLAAVELSRAATVTGALLASTSSSLATANVPPRVALLAEEGLRSLAPVKAKVALALLLAFGVMAVGVGAVAFQGRAVTPPRQAGPKEPPREDQTRTDRHGDPLPNGAVDRLGTLRWRHDGDAFGLAFSPDGKTVAASIVGGRIFLWEAATGRALARLQGDTGPQAGSIGQLAFSPDGRLLAWHDQANIHLWDLKAGTELRRLPLLARNVSFSRSILRFAPDGKTLAWGSSGPALVWDLATGKELLRLGKPGEMVNDLAFSPDGKTLALATRDPAVQLFDTATGDLVRGINAHDSETIEGLTKRLAMAVAFSPDGKRVASTGVERIVISEASTGQEVAVWASPRVWARGLAFTPDGKTLVAGDQEGKVRLYNVADGKERLVLEGGGIARSLALSPDGKAVAMGTTHPTLRLWDVASGKDLFPVTEGHDAPVLSVAFSPDGKLLASGGEGQHIHLWDAATGRHINRLKDHSARTVSFSPDSRRLATVWPGNKTARIWDVARSEVVVNLPHKDIATTPAVAFSPAGQTVVSVDWTEPKADKGFVGTTQIHVWNATDGKHLRDVTIEDFRAESLAVAPDGRLAAVSGWSVIWLCDVERGRALVPLRGHENSSIDAVAFSLDGRTLATGSGDQTVRLWEVATGQEVLALRGHERSFAAVAFSPDGRVVASAEGHRFAERHDIRFWDVATGQELFRLEGADSGVTALAFSPDGQRLVTGLRNSTILVWDLTSRRLPALPAKDLSAKDLAALWSDLAGADAARAHQAVWALAAFPGPAIPFLKEHIKPAPAAEPGRVEKWLADLDSDDFPTREAATRELARVGDQIEPTLPAALEMNPSNEARRRMEAILAQQNEPPSGDRLRGLRAVRVLETIGTPEAGQVLRTLASGPAEARLTREAKAALERMARRALRP